MEKEKFGNFVAFLRKEQGMTQKDLAERLCLTDKAVSKWERGLSFPDISMLEPLAEIFGVTILELLQGERIQEENAISIEETQKIMERSLNISDKEADRKHIQSKTVILICCMVLMFGITLVMNAQSLREWKLKEEQMLQTELDAYRTAWDENGNEVFVNPYDALNQMVQDYQEDQVEEKLTRRLEILENSLKEERKE
ncbi:MAG: helix-turn-helix domain-containing protein [Lachnospiraceae bacterium]|nr:helix-turn-helix domain-containing protein [Lachnospiraceae bacterium]